MANIKWVMPWISGSCKSYFLYAVMGTFAVFALVWIYKKFLSQSSVIHTNKIGRCVFVMMIAMLTVLPYLAYTYTITGRFPYLANSGGMSLYWMSSPFENEYGDWNNEQFDANCVPTQPCNARALSQNHGADIRYVSQFTGVAKDVAYKALAIKNIRNHPVKYIKNCFSNLSRMLFGLPNSGMYQRDVQMLRVFPNGFLLPFLLLTLVYWMRNIRRYNTEYTFVLLLTCVYLFTSILVSAYPRQFYVVLPILLFFIAETLGRYKIVDSSRNLQ